MPLVLVVDDEESIRFTFEYFLSKGGYQVLTAENYAKAKEVISNTNLDLIFVDIILGDYSGIEILKNAREKNPWCPVIIITGQPSFETAAESVRLGAFDYIVKPITKDVLLHKTTLAIKQKLLHDESEYLKAEKEKYRANLEAIFRSVSDGIVTVDNNMHVIEVNKAAEGICNKKKEDICGKEFTCTQSQCEQLSCSEILAETLNKGQAISDYRVECTHINKSRQVIILNSFPLIDKDGRSIGAGLVIKDITRLNDLEKELQERNKFYKIVGKSKVMQGIYNLTEALASIETTVLISGESGTGKELVASALHFMGDRALGPFVKLNCSALAENLLESELFGHCKGAFTGAIRDKRGRFELANKGTIFLDEISDISPAIQGKLIRVLQEKEFEKVGESESIKVDVRVIASTNQDLKEKVRRGEFRKDLYYRLKVVEIKLPPLRERVEDIPLLVAHFCQSFNEKLNKKIEGVSNNVLKLFMHYSWPGNIRELEHAIEHAFILCHDNIISFEHLPSELTDHSKQYIPVISNIEEEQAKIRDTLKRTGWSKAKTARLLGISRQTLYRKMDRYNIAVPSENMHDITDV
jgi:PAS domain S-box-containing protein